MFLFGFLYLKYKYKKYILLIIILLTILFNIHFGCQEKIYNNSYNNHFVKITKKLCIDKKLIKYTKYVGCGTFNFIIFLILLIMPLLINK